MTDFANEQSVEIGNTLRQPFDSAGFSKTTSMGAAPDTPSHASKPGDFKPQFGSKRKILDCPHTTQRYYAKGMCVNCYHRLGRTKKAWACPHKNNTHYSKGLCKYCYLAHYYKHRTVKKGPNRVAADLVPANLDDA